MGGMEYPTLFTADTGWYDPTHITEVTVEHEFGHQYWYAMVATNEFQDAWLDEGINSYTEVTVLDAILGHNTSLFNRSYANAGDYELQRLQYLFMPDYDPVTRWAFKFRSTYSYGGITYGKSATLLATLETLIGRDTMDEAMRTYFMRYRFTHPTTEDFLRTIEEVAIKNGRATLIGGTVDSSAPHTEQNQYHTLETAKAAPGTGATDAADPMKLHAELASLLNSPDRQSVFPVSSLRSFFDQAVYGTQVLDYSVDGISSDPVQWWLPASKDKKQNPYVSTVYLRRKGNFIHPVTVEIVFDDGTRVRENWNGVDRWIKFTYTRNAKIISAEIDPDHAILLDSNFFNNSYTTASNKAPAHKLTNIWLSFNQLAAQLVSWIV